MAELGPTHWNVRPDVLEAILRALRGLDGITWNTYRDHPWAGFDDRSVDFWGVGGRGFPIAREKGRLLVARLMRDPEPPFIRHLIYRRRLWTAWGGWQRWRSGDHSGRLRHVHVTFW